MVYSTVVEDSNFRENDIHHCDQGANQVDGVDGPPWVLVEVSAEDCKGSFLRAGVVGQDGVVLGRE